MIYSQIKLNGRLKYAFCAVLLLMLSTGEMWGGSSTSTYKSTASVSVKSGSGTVYVNTASPATNGSSTTTSTAATKTQSSEASSAPTHTYYVSATPETDWKFSSWTNSNWATAPTTAANKAVTITAATGNGKTATAQATFVQVQITAATPSAVTVTPTNPQSSCTDYSGVLTFTTANDDAASDFLDLTRSDESGTGTFTFTKVWEKNSTSVNYTFKGNGYYGGGTNGSRQNTSTITYSTKGGLSTKSVVFTFNFPNVVISDGSTDLVEPSSPNKDKVGYATFPVTYVDDMNDFTYTITGATGGTWTLGTATFNKTDATSGAGEVTVPFTFNAGGTPGSYSATLTLTATTNAGSASQSVTLNAYSEAEAVNETSVTTSGGETTEYATWAEGLEAANASEGNTLKLLKDVDLGTITATQTISKSMTLDVNGKVLSATVTNATSILTVSTTGVVTIKDSKSGGMVSTTGSYNGTIYGVKLTKGTLTHIGGTIYAENTAQYNSSTLKSCATRGIDQAVGTTLNINGGTVRAIGTRNAYGIYQSSSVANNTTLTITGGVVYSEAAAYAYGLLAYGKVNMSGGTVTGKVNTNTANSANASENNAYAYGMYMHVYANTKAENCYYSTLNMSGGTVNGINEASKTTTAIYAYGILMNASAYIAGTNTTPDGTLTQKVCAIGEISGGTVNVTNNGTYSVGVYVGGSYNSSDNMPSIVRIHGCTINSTAYQQAYGVYAAAVTGTSSSNYGACYSGKVMLYNNTVNATTTTGTRAFALWAQSTYTTIKTATSAIYAGEYAEGAYMYVTSGNYSATTATTTAIAACCGNIDAPQTRTYFDVDGSLGGNAEAFATLIIRGGTFTANAGSTTARAIWNAGNVVMDGGTVTAKAGTTTSNAVYTYRGMFMATGVTFNSTAGTGTAYGIYSDAAINDFTGWGYAGSTTLTNCDVTATTSSGNTAYAVYVYGTTKTLTSTTNATYIPIYQAGKYAVVGDLTVIGGTFTATSAGTTAGGIYRVNTQVSADKSHVAQGTFSVTGATLSAETKDGGTAYGIRSGGPATISGNTISATSSTTGAYGIQLVEGVSEISENTVTATGGTGTAYGIHLATDVNSTNGYPLSGSVSLSDNTVTSKTTSGNTSYAVYVTDYSRNITSGDYMGSYVTGSSAIISSGKYTATAAGTTGYAVALDATKTLNGVSGSAMCTIEGGKFKGSATSTYADVNATDRKSTRLNSSH